MDRYSIRLHTTRNSRCEIHLKWHSSIGIWFLNYISCEDHTFLFVFSFRPGLIKSLFISIITRYHSHWGRTWPQFSNLQPALLLLFSREDQNRSLDPLQSASQTFLCNCNRAGNVGKRCLAYPLKTTHECKRNSWISEWDKQRFCDISRTCAHHRSPAFILS